MRRGGSRGEAWRGDETTRSVAGSGGRAPRHIPWRRTLALVLVLIPAAAAAAGPGPDSLRARAMERLARAKPHERRLALEDLEQAVRLAPQRSDLWLECGRLQLQMGEGSHARASFERAATLAPDEPEAQLVLARAFKADWLETLDDSSFRRSVELLARVTTLAPERPEAWLDLAAFALVRGQPRMAAETAVHAHDADPEGAATTLALACAAYRLGRLRLADSLFRAAERRLPEALARRFADLSVVTGKLPRADDTTTAGERADRFWSEHDPDLTTPESEARLGYLARLGQAMLLFRDGDDVRWDLRTEMIVRYGLPARIVRNRPNAALKSLGLSVNPMFRGEPTEFGYPFNEQVWSYPALGLEVVLWDRTLSGRFSLPVHDRIDQDPRPDARALAGRSDMVVLGDGRGVYLALPPGRHPRAATAHLARFPASRGARIVAHLRTPGGPADTLRGTWVVRDAMQREIARADAAFSVSSCDPTAERTAEFAAELPPGDYRVGFAVEDTRGGRGLATLPLRIAEAPPGLAISDLVALCGDAATAVADASVRIEPSMTARTAQRRTLAVYFEVARLATGERGAGHFSYTWRVLEFDEVRQAWRPQPLVEASREEENVGELRRQFLRVPIERLRPGAYRLDVEVRDLIAGATVRESKEFEIGER